MNEDFEDLYNKANISPFIRTFECANVAREMYDEPAWCGYLEFYLRNGMGCSLYGPAGAGKSTMARQVAKRLGYEVIVVTCHADLTAESLLGGLVAAPDGSTVLAPGPLVLALRRANELVDAGEKGVVVIFEEPNTGRPGVMSIVNNVTDKTRSELHLPDGSSVKPPDNPDGFRVILCYNPSYAGTKQVNQALRDRLPPIYVPPLSIESTVGEIVRTSGLAPEAARRVATFGHVLQASYEQHGVDVTVRGLCRWAMLLAAGVPEQAAFEASVLDLAGDPVSAKDVRGQLVILFKESYLASLNEESANAQPF